MLESRSGEVVAQTKVVHPPDVLRHAGRSFHLVEHESDLARYVER